MASDDVLPLHGGDIVEASARYGIDIDEWIDLSTGMNPDPYPVELDKASFHLLPYVRPEFISASAVYYGSSHFIPVSGTQAAIQHLPSLLADLPVLIPSVGYQEHGKYWRRNGTKICYYDSLEKQTSIVFINNALQENPQQHLVVINPNNPTGVLFEKQQLLVWAKQLAAEAYLIIDEAFIDMTPEQSVLNQSLPDNIIVLRSFGKFFGLAGVRLGYCFANSALLDTLQNYLGLWQVNGPAQAIAIKALQDTQWQAETKVRTQINAGLMRKRCRSLMNLMGASDDECLGETVMQSAAECISNAAREPLVLPYCFHSDFFSSYRMPYDNALSVKEYFARRGILLRLVKLTDKQALLRIGWHDENNRNVSDHLDRQFAAAVEFFLNINDHH